MRENYFPNSSLTTKNYSSFNDGTDRKTEQNYVVQNTNKMRGNIGIVRSSSTSDFAAGNINSAFEKQGAVRFKTGSNKATTTPLSSMPENLDAVRIKNLAKHASELVTLQAKQLAEELSRNPEKLGGDLENIQRNAVDFFKQNEIFY
jgi:hypothetical protein